MTPDKQAAPSEWVEEAMRMAHNFRCAVPGTVFSSEQELLSHLTTQAALCEQLAEALNEIVASSDAQHAAILTRLVDKARSALRAYEGSKQ